MKIAILHYHLKTGGVTTVIQQQIQALKNDHELFVLSGEPIPQSTGFDAAHVPGVGYDNPAGPFIDPERVADAIIAALNKKWETGCDILHIHNPTLKKNKNFLKIIAALQEKGITLFIQIHDFAEDGRPQTYYVHDAYPADCHYGVINSRDYHILLKSGLTAGGLHKIPNTVNVFQESPSGDTNSNHVLYPVRAIRRKNIGEAIFLTLFFNHRETLAITRPPNSMVDFPSYEGWKTFVSNHHLNVEFEASSKRPFEELMFSSAFVMTTSITEGFGFSFLEPWTAGKLLTGRKLSDICEDFEQKNILLDHLYTNLQVPLSWIGKDALLKKWESSMRYNCDKFNFSLESAQVKTFFDRLTENNTIDFGFMDEAFQKQIISQVLSSKRKKTKVIDLNPHLLDIGNIQEETSLITRNKSKVLEHYNIDKYKKSLIDVYTKVMKGPVRQSIDKQALLSHFLQPENYSLLKWNPYVE